MPPGILSSWQAKTRKELRCAIVRHGERADTCWESDWPFSDDAKAYPYDPPLTSVGHDQAKACGERLVKLSVPGADDSWPTTISSPFFRCVQTAVEICRATGAPLLIDENWGEVRFSEFFNADAGVQISGLTRTPQFLAAYVHGKGVTLLNADAPGGKERTDFRPETRPGARDRYAKAFVGCLDRAILSQSSFIVVSHGESLPACFPLFPDYHEADVVAVPHCGMVVGRLELPLSAKNLLEFKRKLPGPGSKSFDIIDGLCVIDTTCTLQGGPEEIVEPEGGDSPDLIPSRKSRFRASFMLRKAQGARASKSPACATFKDLRPLKKPVDLSGSGSPLQVSTPLDVIERGIELDDVKLGEVPQKDDYFETAVEYLDLVHLPLKAKRQVSDLSTQPASTQIDSSDPKVPDLDISDMDSSSLEREYTAEAAIDVAESAEEGAQTAFELAGILTDPTFKKMPSCRAVKWPQQRRGGKTALGPLSCSPMSCARMGPFAPRSPDSKARGAGTAGCTPWGPFAQGPSSPDSNGRVISSRFAARYATEDAAKGTSDSADQSKTSRKEESADPRAIEGIQRSKDEASASQSKTSRKEAPEEPLDLMAIEGNSLFARRRSRRPVPLAI
jgi:broad specificity phosphatase PhoE